MNKSDQQLIQECLKGAQSAFKALYEKYQAYVYTICARHGVSAIEVKDYMQVIFMEVFKSLKNYDADKAQFKTWLSRIAINQILQQRRKRRIDYTSLEKENINLIESSFTIPIDWKIDQEVLFALLNKMPAKYITVFNLFIIDGYSHQEISVALNIPENTSRVLLHRGRVWAMKQLRCHFSEHLGQLEKHSKIG